MRSPMVRFGHLARSVKTVSVYEKGQYYLIRQIVLISVLR